MYFGWLKYYLSTYILDIQIYNFQAYKYQADYGGELSLGNYVSGEGTFDSDPMIFEGGDSINCGNGQERDSIAYWYCWYTAFPDEVVALDYM